MRRSSYRVITDESVLILSIMKWIGLSGVVGGVVGVLITGFLLAIKWGISFFQSFPYYFLSLPIVLFATSLLLQILLKEQDSGMGTEKLINAVHKKNGDMPFKTIPIKFLTTVLTISAGGSAGQESPAAHMGGTVASTLSRLFRFSKRDQRKLVICGISAGFSAVFGTPLAGALFGVEVLFVGGLTYEVLLPSLVAGIISYQVAVFLGSTYHHVHIEDLPIFDLIFISKVVMAGVLFGMVAIVIIEVFKTVRKISEKIRIYTPIKGLLGGSILVLIALLTSVKHLGLGADVLDSALLGETTSMATPFLKMLTTAITLSFGGSGGTITPVFYVGATFGAALATLMDWHVATFAACGMVGVLAGAANTPIAASILAVEMFGSEIGPYATLACVISYLTTGYRSLFPSQILTASKSPSFVHKKGQGMGENVGYSFDTRRLLVRGKKLSDMVKQKMSNKGSRMNRP